MKKKYFILGLLFIASIELNAKTINVPSDYPKIQTAVNSASNGDTILVSPGIYYENINLLKKNLVLTSHYLLQQDTGYIGSTIINGSRPSHSDTASCILITGGQDSTTVVQGFTITGGQGTAWKDEHSNGTYREGGGIFAALSSPVIQYNLITKNFAVNKKGLSSAGGGGIRCGDGNVKILNNVITGNTALYGGGIVLNHCAAVIRNNIIAGNYGGEDYGGGGLWINCPDFKKNVWENNTIVCNRSQTSGGGVNVYNAVKNAITMVNNIIYGNIAPATSQVRTDNTTVSFCNIENVNLPGIINSYPQFADSFFFISNNSPCIDGGSTNSAYNDPNNINNTGNALFPSKGTIRNDIGAYGGPYASLFPYFSFSRIAVPSTKISFDNNIKVNVPSAQKLVVANQSSDTRRIDSVVVMLHKDDLKITHFPVSSLKPSQSDSIIINWTPADNLQFTDTILIYHNTTGTINPVKISVMGKTSKILAINEAGVNNSVRNSPNPFYSTTNIDYSYNDEPASLTVYDVNGRILKSYSVHRGSGSVKFDGSHLSQGTYFCRLVTRTSDVVNKMILIR